MLIFELQLKQYGKGKLGYSLQPKLMVVDFKFLCIWMLIFLEGLNCS